MGFAVRFALSVYSKTVFGWGIQEPDKKNGARCPKVFKVNLFYTPQG